MGHLTTISWNYIYWACGLCPPSSIVQRQNVSFRLYFGVSHLQNIGLLNITIRNYKVFWNWYILPYIFNSLNNVFIIILFSLFKTETMHHAMNTNGGVEVQLHAFLTSALNGGEWSAGPQRRSGRGGEKKNSQHLSCLELPIIQPVA